jgi:hypothetical protein
VDWERQGREPLQIRPFNAMRATKETVGSNLMDAFGVERDNPLENLFLFPSDLIEKVMGEAMFFSLSLPSKQLIEAIVRYLDFTCGGDSLLESAKRSAFKPNDAQVTAIVTWLEYQTEHYSGIYSGELTDALAYWYERKSNKGAEKDGE